MRDLLANLHQEELSLMMHDRASWNKVMEERAHIMEYLSSWRTMRMEALTKLSKYFKQEPVLEELLPSQDENSCEVLSLRDQIVALMERMNNQNLRNQALYKQVEKNLTIPMPMIRPKAQPRAARRRSSVITDNSRDP